MRLTLIQVISICVFHITAPVLNHHASSVGEITFPRRYKRNVGSLSPDSLLGSYSAIMV